MLAITLALSIFFSPSGFAGMNGKYDVDLAETSRKYAEAGLPSGTVELPWGPQGLSGELDADTVPSYRHLHTFLATAFYAKRKDQRETALRWLERYACENWIACRDLKQLHDTALKANVLKMSKDHRRRHEALRTRFAAALMQAEKAKPREMGLCRPELPNNPWLELEYQLLCPGRSTGTETGFAPGSPALAYLQKKLEWDSQQVLLSSSFLKSLAHHGDKDCLQPWEAVIACGGGRDLELRYQCSRESGKVACQRAGATSSK